MSRRSAMRSAAAVVAAAMVMVVVAVLALRVRGEAPIGPAASPGSGQPNSARAASTAAAPGAGREARRSGPAAAPPRMAPGAVAEAPPKPPLMNAGQVYDLNPTLIPGFVAVSTDQLEDPENGPRETRAWGQCGWEHAERAGLPHEGAVRITLGYTLEVTNQEAVLVDLERLEGGDDELARCLRDARPWMNEPFKVPGAKDGTFRWQAAAAAVPLGAQPLRPVTADESAAQSG